MNIHEFGKQGKMVGYLVIVWHIIKLLNPLKSAPGGLYGVGPKKSPADAGLYIFLLFPESFPYFFLAAFLAAFFFGAAFFLGAAFFAAFLAFFAVAIFLNLTVSKKGLSLVNIIPFFNCKNFF